MLLDCSRILDHVVEPGAHLWQGIPGVPRDLVGVVAERQSDALLVGSVLVRVNANPLVVLHLAGVVFSENLYYKMRRKC